MKIDVIVIGKSKGALLSASEEYTKMISKYADILVSEIKEERIPAKASDAQIEAVLDKEAEAILKRIGERDYVYALSPAGHGLDSVTFSADLRNAFDVGQSKVVFVVGSSYGLGKEVYKRANFNLSFGKMTFPHQLFRVMLLEQIFRAFKIANNETYHK
ncbi:MAG: Ribosomal RNA large subunit methyltransferase H [Tenericutes bacterium ADurb.Bin087]|nr:MAG: Ribosomal RNA large subunit methyltransferase H [Tenericutes bacterium ADurb.Bin087]